MLEPILYDRRHHARRAIGRRRHDLPSSSVLFVDGHRVDADPVVDLVRRIQVRATLGQQRLVDSLGAAAHLKTTGQDTVIGKSTFDAVVHDLPQARHAAAQVFRSATRDFVRFLHLGDGFAAGFGHFQHFGRAFERIGHRRTIVGVPTGGQFVGCQDEAATDRIVGLLQDHVALLVGRHEDHSVRMARQVRAEVELKILFRMKLQHRHPRRRHRAGLADGLQNRLGLVVVVGFRPKAGQTQDRGAIGCMAYASEGKRAVQTGSQAMELER